MPPGALRRALRENAQPDGRPLPPPVARRIARREALRQQGDAARPLPRPVVRPAAPPRPVMTPRPAPAARPPVSRPPAALGAAAGVGGALLALNAAAAHPSLRTNVQFLQSALERLQAAADFQSMEQDLTRLQSNLDGMVTLLESARKKGYVFQPDLDEHAYQAVSAWQTVQSQVRQRIPQQTAAWQTQLRTLSAPVAQLNAVLGNPAAARVRLQQMEIRIQTLTREAEAARSTLQANYAEISSTAATLNTRLKQIHWALDQLSQARFTLERGEDLIMAVRSRWDKEGKDDPEGVLYLTTQRVIFERKEKLARKKVLFITVNSELVQEVLIDQPLKNIKNIQAASKGLFGHQDFLELSFAAPDLAAVSMHLDGQDSQAWDALLRKAMSGELERASTAGISLHDLTRPLTQADLLALQGEVNNLQDEMLLKGVRQALEGLEARLAGLRRQLSALRARGYGIEKSLESDLEVLSIQWDRVRQNALTVLEQQTAVLSETMQTIQADLARLMGGSGALEAARPQYMQLKSAISSAQAQAEAAEDTVFAQFDAYDDEIDALESHLSWVDWMLQALATASFPLLATESGVAAVEAVWLRPGLEPENGILFLTDQRLLWEDRVGDFELKLNIPLSQVQAAQTEPEDQEETDILKCMLTGDASVAEARFLLQQPVGEVWVAMILRARSGAYADDRAVPIDETELAHIRNAPTQCQTCGAPLSNPVLRGQVEITCEYCGAVVRW
ncbi:MAG: hypothetical protein Fur0018_05950 [Anaerolineales bacterium]